jgi:integrase
MKQNPSSRRRRSSTKSVLRLPDLEHAKAAVLNSLNSADAKRGYRHAIDEFVDWYCSEPRLANRIVVLRYRSHLESRQLAPGTINLRLGAVRRLSYEAADCGLLSADLAAGVRRVKGVKKLGIRLGNWLTAEQGHALWQAPDHQRLKGKRERALLALLLACGLRRHEAVALTLDHLQQREDHWAIVDLADKGGHVRTVPAPDGVRTELNDWLAAAAIDRGKVFRRVNKIGRTGGDGMTVKAVWHIVKESAKSIGVAKLAPHDLRRTCARLWHASGGELEQDPISFGARFSAPNATLAASSEFDQQPMIALASSRTLMWLRWLWKGYRLYSRNMRGANSRSRLGPCASLAGREETKVLEVLKLDTQSFRGISCRPIAERGALPKRSVPHLRTSRTPKYDRK